MNNNKVTNHRTIMVINPYHMSVPRRSNFGHRWWSYKSGWYFCPDVRLSDIPIQFYLYSAKCISLSFALLCFQEGLKKEAAEQTQKLLAILEKLFQANTGDFFVGTKVRHFNNVYRFDGISMFSFFYSLIDLASIFAFLNILKHFPTATPKFLIVSEYMF